MISYPYINSLFKAILNVSEVIDGRYFMCPKWGSEINSAFLSEVVLNAGNGIKYPAALCMPPRKTGNFQFSGEEVGGTQIGYNYLNCQMLFLRPTTYTAYNQPSQPLPNTQIPTHTAIDCWHDMGRCAEDFLQVLRQVIIYNSLQGTINISENAQQSITPVSDIGNDKLSGVLLSFVIMLNGGCAIEDYPSDYLTEIQVPLLIDTHPTHINS